MWRANGLPTTATDVSPVRGLEQAFANQLDALGVDMPFALAVSGGGDSAALMHLASAWAREHDISLHNISVLTVDHGLRANSRAEAEEVGAWARALGLAHHTLLWEGDKPTSGLQAAARAARRELLCRWCRQHDVPHILMAHTADDQVETVGMRLARGSGIAGLGGMAAEANGPFGVRILRPLLGVARSDLRLWLSARGISWIEDPSNDNAVFERVRMRHALAADDVTAAQLSALAVEAGAARAALDSAADDFLREAAEVHAAGWARVDLGAFRIAPDRVAQHALVRILRGFGGSIHPPHRESLARLFEGLGAHDFKGATLSGCRIVPEGLDSALFGRETRNLSAHSLTARQWSLWDHRFEIWSPEAAEVLPLGALGLGAFEGTARERVKAAVPPPFRGALPVIRGADGRLVVPHAGIDGGPGGNGELRVVFSGMRPFGPLEPGTPPKRM